MWVPLTQTARLFRCHCGEDRLELTTLQIYPVTVCDVGNSSRQMYYEDVQQVAWPVQHAGETLWLLEADTHIGALLDGSFGIVPTLAQDVRVFRREDNGKLVREDNLLFRARTTVHICGAGDILSWLGREYLAWPFTFRGRTFWLLDEEVRVAG